MSQFQRIVMKNMTEPLEIIFILNNKASQISQRDSDRYSHHHKELQRCQLRSQMINWLYGAQESFQTSRSALFSSIAILDRLILWEYNINLKNCQLVAAAIFLLATKVHETYKPSFKGINVLLNKDQDHQTDGYVQMEASILEYLDFTLLDDQELYRGLAELEDNYHYKGRESVEGLVQKAVRSPSLFRYGPAVLLKAIQNCINNINIRLTDSQRNSSNKQVNQIKTELSQLIQECQ